MKKGGSILLIALPLLLAAGPVWVALTLADDLSTVTTSVSVPTQTGTLQIIGYASPTATVTFKESGAVIGTQVANSQSYFDKTLTALSAGIHVLDIYAVNGPSHVTLTITFSVNVIAGSTTIVSGLLLPPTIVAAGTTVKRPAELTVEGRARNNASVQLFLSGSGDSQSLNVSTDGNGVWSANANPKLHLGAKTANALALDGSGGQSELSQSRLYEVLLSADLNIDNLINLTDFSVLMYNYGTNNPSNVVADINDNGQVNLTDFSVMMYYWTGG